VGVDVSEPAAPPARPWLRPVLALGAFALVLGAARASGLLDDLSPASIRALVARAGAFGAVAYVGIYVLGILLQVPGWVFIGAAVLAWGKPVAFGLSYLASAVAAVIAFSAFRRAGGQPLQSAQRPWVKKLLDGIEARPLRVMVVLRLVFVVSPPLNFALALTPVNLRDYVVATVVGIGPPIAFMVAAYGWLFQGA
jgi:uncharacterized membrane protein YdjX (TVP38/TMEM64 family)